MSHAIPDWEPLSEQALADQRGTYDRQRGVCPVARSLRGVTLFRHADVVAAAADPATFSSAASSRVSGASLATSSDVQAALRAGACELAPAIDEILRIDDPFLVNRRVATAATRVVFGDPDAYKPHEHAARNVVYGTGIHVCPGRPLATLEFIRFAARPADGPTRGLTETR